MLATQILGRFSVLPLLAGLALFSCSDSNASGPEGGEKIPAPDGPRGGWVLEIGDGVIGDILNDPHVQTVRLYLLEADRKTPKPVAALPVLVVRTRSGERRLQEPVPQDMLDGAASHFVFEDECLKADVVRGHLEIEIGGKPRKVPFAMEHVHSRDH